MIEEASRAPRGKGEDAPPRRRRSRRRAGGNATPVAHDNND
jgi:poly(A) polymerase